MPLPTFDSADAIPEAFRDLYAERDGKFVPKIENPDGILSNYERLQRESKAAADRLKQYEGLDPEAARAALSAAEKAEQERLKAAGDWESREKSLAESYEKKLTAEQQRAAALEQAVYRKTAKAAVVEALQQERGSAKLLEAVALSRVKVEVQGDDYVAVVLDDKGQPAYVDGRPMTVRELVASFKADPEYARAFDGTTASGGGATGSVTALGGKAFNPKTATTAEKVAFIGTHGRAEYEKLVMQAHAA